MQRKRDLISKAPITRMLLNAGAKRVSIKAAKVLGEIVRDLSFDIAKRAVEISKHSGRKTVNKEDILLASKK
jgi:DNA-binding protein